VNNSFLPVAALFTGRYPGASRAPYDAFNLSDAVGDRPESVAANRDALAQQMGAPVVFMRPEHGATVVWVDAAALQDAHRNEIHRDDIHRDTIAQGDILITTTPGIALAALAADCVPVLMHDAASGAVVAAHVGRRGLMAGAVESALDALAGLHDGDTQWSHHVSVAIGPAICGHCYEVPDSLHDQVVARHPAASAITQWGSPGLDIRSAIGQVLDRWTFASVVVDERCTYEDAGLFSFRRDQTCGRQAAVVRCEGPRQ